MADTHEQGGKVHELAKIECTLLTMCVHVMAAAKRMCEKSNWTLSNLSLQKILYMAHMFHLGDTDTPLVPGNFEAWDFGPVHPELYHSLKMFGASPVQNIFRQIGDVPEEGTEAEWLDNAVENLGSVSSSRLVTLTHNENGAWAKRYTPGGSALITNEDILEEYQYWTRDRDRDGDEEVRKQA